MTELEKIDEIIKNNEEYFVLKGKEFQTNYEKYEEGKIKNVQVLCASNKKSN